jgi:hypothetical protein
MQASFKIRPVERFNASSQYNCSDFEILMKIASEDPTMQACLKVIASTCLAHGIDVECETGQATKKFAAFVQRHYVNFCENAIRCMFTCGFVPWRLRRLESGALIPETIPLGTFVWSAEKNAVANRSKTASKNIMSIIENPPKRQRKRPHSTEALAYKIRFVESLGIMEDEVEMYTYVQPMGLHHASLQSPIGGIVSQYRLIAGCLARVEYADEWNTQAKFVCSYASTNSMYAMNEGNPITNDWCVPQNRDGLISDNNLPTEMEQNVYVRDAVMERVMEMKNTSHDPTVSLSSPSLLLRSVTYLTLNTVDIFIAEEFKIGIRVKSAK